MIENRIFFATLGGQRSNKMKMCEMCQHWWTNQLALYFSFIGQTLQLKDYLHNQVNIELG